MGVCAHTRARARLLCTQGSSSCDTGHVPASARLPARTESGACSITQHAGSNRRKAKPSQGCFVTLNFFCGKALRSKWQWYFWGLFFLLLLWFFFVFLNPSRLPCQPPGQHVWRFFAKFQCSLVYLTARSWNSIFQRADNFFSAAEHDRDWWPNVCLSYACYYETTTKSQACPQGSLYLCHWCAHSQTPWLFLPAGAPEKDQDSLASMPPNSATQYYY